MVRKALPDEVLMALRQRFELRSTRRAGPGDSGPPRRAHGDDLSGSALPGPGATAAPNRRWGPPHPAPAKLERYCELIAALKVRTRNAKGRQLLTPEAIRLFEDYGIETPAGRVVAAAR